MGNVLGYIGHGPRLVAMDAHIDTVGIGNIKNWDFDPYEGMETDELIGGRGTSTVKAAWRLWYMPVKSLKISVWKMNIPCWLPVLQEEDCDGLCGNTLLNNPAFARNFVVSTEPTDCVYRGQRGRMEIPH